MQLLLILIDAIGLALGSVMATGLLCWLFWSAFRLINHPECAAVAILVLLALAVVGELPRSLFLDMVLAFAAVAALPLWMMGRAWCKNRRDEIASGAIRPAATSSPGRTDAIPS